MIQQSNRLKRYFSIVLIVLCICYGPSLAQEDRATYVPPSPNAAALLEYASIPVTLYTGVPEISLPIFQLKGRKSTIPISISYHASGIKVQDIASSVGLGFALNAGGVITRLVRGLPDENPMGYLNQPFNTIFSDVAKYNDIARGDLDSEPDVFYYNFNGKTGRIVFDPNKNCVELPEQNLKIDPPDFSTTDPTWVITDIDGIKYTFGKTANARETTSSTLDYPVKLQTYISSWYLSEITYPFDTEVVNFNYREGSNIYYENYRQYQSSSIEQITQCNPPPGWPGYSTAVDDIITQITINFPKYISSISTSLGTASFSYENDRQDISNALRLSQISIVNIVGAEVKKYTLNNNQYFISDGCNDSDCKRLKLGSLVETTNGANLTLRTFIYNLTNLPSRKSIQYDHWGYYNNNSFASAIPPSKIYPYYGGTISYPGADKSPDLSKTLANILRRIENSAGGFQELYYQLNDYDENGTTKSTGGLRISQIVENDGSGINGTITRNFKYRKRTDPSKSAGIIYRNHNYEFKYINSQYCAVSGTYGYSYIARYSTSLIDFFDIGGIHIGYPETQIEYSNGAKEHLSFTNFVDRPDDPTTFFQPPNVSSPDFTNPDGPPFITKSDRSFERGLLKEHLYFNSAGEKVKRIRNFYDYYVAAPLISTGGKLMLLQVIGNSLYHRKGTYSHVNRGVRLLETIETTYDQTDETKYFSSRRTFTYNADYSTLVKTTTTYLNDGTELLEEYKYPKDYSYSSANSADVESSGINGLVSKYIVSKPIEVVNSIKKSGWTNYQVTGARLTTFWKYPNNIKNVVSPYKDFYLKANAPITNFVNSSISLVSNLNTFNKDARYQQSTSYDSYDTYGNLTQETARDGQISTYQWGHSNTLVIGITINSQTSTFSHSPLIGLTSITDPGLRSTRYSYDIYNRLKLVSDHDYNIMNRYSYHYKNQNDFHIGLSNSNDLATIPITFSSVYNEESAGITSYVWDFGDGEVVEVTSKSANHTYSSPGTYTVKLSKINPEYGSLFETKSLSIYPPIGVTLNGHSSVNRCTTSSVTFTASGTGGCSSLAYTWYSRPQGSTSWTYLGAGSTLSFNPNSFPLGVREIQCVASDNVSCGHSKDVTTTIFIYCN